MATLTQSQRDKLTKLLTTLIDQKKAHVLVEPYRRATGFWFGGGNTVRDDDGTLYLCGRYRNFGDSRTGLAAGERGLECAIFASTDNGATFQKVKSWSKADLSFPGNEVLSIEGTKLHKRRDGSWELFVSTEKKRNYPERFASYLKPGCGVWSIDLIVGSSIANLDAGTIRSILVEEENPGHIHVKDPVVFDGSDGKTVLVFCSHPYCWTCSNSGIAIRDDDGGDFRLIRHEFVPRGPTWDVAGTRVTGKLDLPRIGAFADAPYSVLLYDGLECVRQLEENSRAVKRPRGYSCEEISGALVGSGEDYAAYERLSDLAPLFISPWGTGSSRYADILATPEGLFASWEQSQDDLSQPLVGNFVSNDKVAELLS